MNSRRPKKHSLHINGYFKVRFSLRFATMDAKSPEPKRIIAEGSGTSLPGPGPGPGPGPVLGTPHSSIWERPDRKSTRLNSSHSQISYAVFCLKKKKKIKRKHNNKNQFKIKH